MIEKNRIEDALNTLCSDNLHYLISGDKLDKSVLHDKVWAYALQTYIMFIRNEKKAKQYIVDATPDIWVRNICLNFINDVDKLDFINIFSDKCKKEMPTIFKIIVEQEQYYRSRSTANREHISMPTSLIMQAFQKEGGKMRIELLSEENLFRVTSVFGTSSYYFKSNHYAYAIMMSLLKSMSNRSAIYDEK